MKNAQNHFFALPKIVFTNKSCGKMCAALLVRRRIIPARSRPICRIRSKATVPSP